MMFRTGPRNLITDVDGLEGRQCRRCAAEIRRHRASSATSRRWPASRFLAARREHARPTCSNRTTASRRSTRSCSPAARLSGLTPRRASRRRCASRASASTSADTACRSCRPPSCSTFAMAATRIGAAIRPIANSAIEAVRAAASDFAIGTEGAGTGALSSGLKGGLGSASTMLDNGVTIGALAAVNPTGSVDGRARPPFLGGPFRDRRRIRRPRLSLADAGGRQKDPAEIPRQSATGETPPSRSSPPTPC